MDLSLRFYEKDNFSIFIDSIYQHHLTGRFKVNNFNCDFTHHFNGLIYQLAKGLYNFTFSIDWRCMDVTSQTTFTGTLHLNSNSHNQNVLDLKWLVVNDNEDSIQGSSRLFEEHQGNDLFEGQLPFPNTRLFRKAMVS